MLLLLLQRSFMQRQRGAQQRRGVVAVGLGERAAPAECGAQHRGAGAVERLQRHHGRETRDHGGGRAEVRGVDRAEGQEEDGWPKEPGESDAAECVPLRVQSCTAGPRQLWLSSGAQRAALPNYRAHQAIGIQLCRCRFDAF